MVQLTSRPEGPSAQLYGDATMFAGVFYDFLIKREVVPSATEHHIQEGLMQLPSAPERSLPQCL